MHARSSISASAYAKRLRARAWLHLTTDAEGDVAPGVVEAADLALWTGRLAYVGPGWKPSVGPAHDTRPPQDLAPNMADFNAVLATVHQANLTLTTLAATDDAQIRTAARTGRLLIPVVQLRNLGERGRPFVRAPSDRIDVLLTAYREDGTARRH